jgi:hypothetical protein
LICGEPISKTSPTSEGEDDNKMSVAFLYSPVSIQPPMTAANLFIDNPGQIDRLSPTHLILPSDVRTNMVSEGEG